MDTSPDAALAEFIRYNNWANQRVLDACRDLGEDSLSVAMPGAYGTIRDTLRHIIEAEAWYLELLIGDRPRPPFEWAARPGFDEMKDYAARIGDLLAQAVGRVDPTARITEVDQGRTFHYQARAVFIQIINHGVEHRTNITTILSAAQIAPPAVDGWAYLSANPERFDYDAG